MHTNRKKVTAVMILLALFVQLTMAGCGGGGGGGSTAVAPTPTPTPSGSVALLAKTAFPGAASWGTHEISATPGQTVLADIKITNNSGSATSPVALVTLPAGNEVTLIAGSVYTEWTESGAGRMAGRSAGPIERTIAERTSFQMARSAGKSAAIADTVATTTTSLGYSLASNDWSYMYFNLKVANTATSGVKSIVVTVNGVPTTININVTASSTCQAVTNPTCGTGTHSVTHPNDTNGCAVANTCDMDTCLVVTNPTCGTNQHSVSHANVNGCAVANTCEANSCTAVTNPTCGTNQHPVTHPNDANGCAVANTCEADVVAAKGTVRVSSNLNVASEILTCAGQSNHMPMVYDLTLYEKGWGYTVQMNPGACTLSCRNDVPNKVVDTANSLTSATLASNGLIDLYCVYKANSGSGPVCGNHIQETGEQCDDGNIANGDGCSSTCQNEGSGPGGPQL